jgi:outer membrane protein assembly factor BamD (BamD/ComL family)
MNRLLIALTGALLLSSCATANITSGMSAAELIQRGQEAMDRNRYKIAIQYYEALYENNKTNIDLIITAEYHIAFIHYKQAKFEQARNELNAVLEYYNSPDEELYPQHFKRLSQIVIDSIDEREKNRKLINRKINRK